jgi:hypothetical protein
MTKNKKTKKTQKKERERKKKGGGGGKKCRCDIKLVSNCDGNITYKMRQEIV